MLPDTILHAFLALYRINLDFIRFLGSLLQSNSVLAAENLFLRKQLALYQERQVQPRRATDATQLTMAYGAKTQPIPKIPSISNLKFLQWTNESRFPILCSLM
jgi:hypothetical protein